MFANFFHKQQPYRQLNIAATSLRFLGEPSGNGLMVLKQELATILADEGNTRSAYLSRVKYPDEEQIRVVLIIDGTAPAQKMAQVIAAECQSLVAIDLMFFESLTGANIAQLQEIVPPFFPS